MATPTVPAFRTALVILDEGRFPLTLFMPLVYDSVRIGRTITVPAGFPTDLASIPRGLWNILPRAGAVYDKAAVIHDYLYTTNGVTRGDADAVLLEAMVLLGVGWWTRTLIYRGVRLGGWRAWRRYRDAATTHTAPVRISGQPQTPAPPDDPHPASATHPHIIYPPRT